MSSVVDFFGFMGHNLAEYYRLASNSKFSYPVFQMLGLQMCDTQPGYIIYIVSYIFILSSYILTAVYS